MSQQHNWDTANEALLNAHTLESLQTLERAILDDDSRFSIGDLALILGAIDEKITLLLGHRRTYHTKIK